MKLKFKHIVSFEEADALIDKYYEGSTTVNEEKQLNLFLKQSNLPPKYKPEQAIFGFFESEKVKPVFKIHPYVKWAGVAAVALIVSVQTLTWNHSESFAYVDGMKITNKNELRTQALASLRIVSTENNEVEQSFNGLNDSEIMQQQLEIFQ